MSLKKLSVLLGALVVVSMILTACPAPAPQTIEKVVTQVVTSAPVVQVQTQVVKEVQTQVVQQVVTQQVTQVVETTKEEYTTPHPILSDVRVRQAIAHCSNRDELIASVYPFVDDATKAKLRMDSWIPKTSWAYGGPYQDYEFSPEKGGALLDAAGWKLPEGGTIRENDKQEPLALKFTTTNAQFRQTWSAVFVQQMAKCGIQILPQYTPASWWFGDTTGLARRDYELGAYAWVGEPDPGGRTLYACDQIPLPSNNWEGQNTMGWCNKAASDAIVKANNTLIKDERKAAYNIVQQEFVKDMVSLPVFQRVEGEAWSNNLEGLKVDPTEYTTANIADWTLKGGDTVVLGMSQEPASMYSLVEQAATEVVASFVGGQARLFTKWNYDYQPFLQDPLSTIESGLTKNNAVDVKAGDTVYNTSGKPVKLEKGTKVFDADGKEVDYDGSSPLKMKQLVITYRLKDYTWSDGVKGTSADMELGFKNDCDKDSGATSFIFCDAIVDKQFAPDKLEATITMVPGYQDPLYMTYPFQSGLYPSHQKLSDGRMLKDVPAKEWATLPEIAEKPLSWGPFQLVDWKKGQSMTFEANKYANPAPKIKKVVIQFFPDTQTAVAALLGGDVDWLEKSTLGAGAEVQTVLDAAKQGKVKVELGPNPTWEHIDMNLFTK